MDEGNDEDRYEYSWPPKERQKGRLYHLQRKVHNHQQLQARFNEIAIDILNSNLRDEQKESLLNILYDAYSSKLPPMPSKGGLTKEAREFLERVYSRKQKLTREERQLVAEKCKLTPIQVRIWFINKRSRSRERRSTTDKPTTPTAQSTGG